MPVSWASFLNDGIYPVVRFFSNLFYSVFPSSIVKILFLFPALLLVFALARFFRDCFSGGD